MKATAWLMMRWPRLIPASHINHTTVGNQSNLSISRQVGTWPSNEWGQRAMGSSMTTESGDCFVVEIVSSLGRDRHWIQATDEITKQRSSIHGHQRNMWRNIRVLLIITARVLCALVSERYAHFFSVRYFRASEGHVDEYYRTILCWLFIRLSLIFTVTTSTCDDTFRNVNIL